MISALYSLGPGGCALRGGHAPLRSTQNRLSRLRRPGGFASNSAIAQAQRSATQRDNASSVKQWNPCLPTKSGSGGWQTARWLHPRWSQLGRRFGIDRGPAGIRLRGACPRPPRRPPPGRERAPGRQVGRLLKDLFNTLRAVDTHSGFSPARKRRSQAAPRRRSWVTVDELISRAEAISSLVIPPK